MVWNCFKVAHFAWIKLACVRRSHSPAPAALNVCWVWLSELYRELSLPQYRPQYLSSAQSQDDELRIRSGFFSLSLSTTEVPCTAAIVSPHPRARWRLVLSHGDVVTGLFCFCFSFPFPVTWRTSFCANRRWCLTRDVAFLVFSFFMIMVR